MLSSKGKSNFLRKLKNFKMTFTSSSKMASLETSEEESSQEEDATVVLEMFLVEDIMITQVIQVVTGLINQRFDVISVINLVIMHMNAGRSNMNKESKARINRRTRAFRRAQC